MGYYDDNSSASSDVYKTKQTSCSKIAPGQFLLLQGRPCQVIRITGPSTTTGQYRYLGVDLGTKQLHEDESSKLEASGTSGPDQVVQVLDLEEWRILDIADGYATAMTRTGDVQSGVAIVDQSNLWTRLKAAFESERGSLRGLILTEGGRHLIVEMKVVTGDTV